MFDGPAVLSSNIISSIIESIALPLPLSNKDFLTSSLIVSLLDLVNLDFIHSQLDLNLLTDQLFSSICIGKTSLEVVELLSGLRRKD
jgi:hypothetical protein